MSSDAKSTSVESSQPDPLLLAYQKDYTKTLTKVRSNDIPGSSGEKAELHAYVVRACKDFDSCAEDTTRTHISKTLELQESLLAPIRILPSEILYEIFQLVVRTSSRPGFEPGIRYVAPKNCMGNGKLCGTDFLFTWVCVWWRNEAPSQPAFWSCIDVRFRHRDPHPSFEMLEFLKQCISRTGSYAPMNIRIDLDYSNNQTIAPARLRVLETLLERADRWRTLTLNAYGRLDFSLQIINLFDANHARAPSVPLFPALEDLMLTLRRCDPPSLERMFHYFPPLQSLDTSALFETDTVNFELLLKLRVRVYTGHSLAGLLRKCPSLKYLKVSCFTSQHRSTLATSFIDTNVISHPLLSRIEMGSVRNIHLGAWSFVCLPSLTQLDVSLYATIPERELEEIFELGTPLTELREMIERSRCTLEKVNLNIDPPNTIAPGLALRIGENFLKNLPAKSLCVDSMLWPDWRQLQEERDPLLEAAGFS